MESVKVEVSVSKEAYELGQGVVAFVSAMKTAMADGWQMGQDLPVMMASAMGDLIPALQGADKVLEESKDVAAFSKAVGLSVADLVGVFAKKA